MDTRVTIRNDETDPTAPRLAVTVVTVGNSGPTDAQHLLGPGESTQVVVRPGQFVMLDDKQERG